MDISFDPAKRAWTLAERGLDFADAGLVFEGLVWTREDTRFDYPEHRFTSTGMLGGRCVVVVWTPRDEGRRIISMRHTHAGEEAAFQRAVGRPG